MTPTQAVQQFAPLVHQLVARYLKRSRHLVSFREDITQEGFVGLVIAAKKFDPARGVKFITYAHYWVRAYVQAACLQMHGATTGRERGCNNTPALWRHDDVAKDVEGYATYDTTATSVPRPDHLVELKDLSEKMYRAAKKAAASTRDLDIFLERANAARAAPSAPSRQNDWHVQKGGTLPGDDSSFVVLGAKYGITKQAASLIDKKVSAAVRAWGKEVQREAA